MARRRNGGKNESHSKQAFLEEERHQSVGGIALAKKQWTRLYRLRVADRPLELHKFRHRIRGSQGFQYRATAAGFGIERIRQTKRSADSFFHGGGGCEVLSW